MKLTATDHLFGATRRSSRRWLIVTVLLLVFGSVAVTINQGQGTNIRPNVIYALGTTEDEAAAVLGVPVPGPRGLPLGIVRSAITLDQPDTIVGVAPRERKVRQSYAVGGRDLALLTIFRGALGASLDSPSTVQLGTLQVQVSTKTLSDGTEAVFYRWQRGTLVLFMDINLIKGITRPVADAIVASVN